MPSRLNSAQLANGFTPKPVQPVQLRRYRLGLLACGLVWVLLASSLCGCMGAANGWVKNQSGRAYYRHGNYQAARSEFERALMDNPNRAAYAYNVARTMEKQGDLAGAEELYQHALSLNPAHRPSYTALSEMLNSQGRTDDARELLAAWTYTQPYAVASKVQSAKIERSAGNYAGAEQHLTAALNQRPGNGAARREMKSLQREMGNPDRASNLAYYRNLSQNPYFQSMEATVDPMTGLHPSPAQHMASYMPAINSTYPTGVIQATYNHQGNFSGIMPSGGIQMNGMPIESMPMGVPGQMAPMGNPQIQGMEMHHQGWTPTEQGQPVPGSIQNGPLLPTPAPGVPMQGAPQNMNQGMNVPHEIHSQAMPMSPSMPMSPAMSVHQTTPVPARHPEPMHQGHFHQQPVPSPYGGQPVMGQPTMGQPMMGQPVMSQPGLMPQQMPAPTQQPVELGQPVPITQGYMPIETQMIGAGVPTTSAF